MVPKQVITFCNHNYACSWTHSYDIFLERGVILYMSYLLLQVVMTYAPRHIITTLSRNYVYSETDNYVFSRNCLWSCIYELKFWWQWFRKKLYWPMPPSCQCDQFSVVSCSWACRSATYLRLQRIHNTCSVGSARSDGTRRKFPDDSYPIQIWHFCCISYFAARKTLKSNKRVRFESG